MQFRNSQHGLFVGLTTLDLIYRADHPPDPNEKLVASDYTVSAGGPATNAAVTFRHLGSRSTLISAIGSHPVTQLIRADLQACDVTIVDLAPDRSDPPPVSSIVVTEATGERAVISLNAVKAQISADRLPRDCLQDVAIVLIDGHQMELGRAIAQQAKEQQIPVAIDGGSWKPGFETVLPFVDYAICSANFRPPGCQSESEVLDYLMTQTISQIVITHGSQPIVFQQGDRREALSVPQLRAVDTLGAGDIFHGAFCHFILQTDFPTALTEAAKIAAYSCQFFGTRRWITDRTE